METIIEHVQHWAITGGHVFGYEFDSKRWFDSLDHGSLDAPQFLPLGSTVSWQCAGNNGIDYRTVFGNIQARA